MEKLNVTQKLISSHLREGSMEPGREIAIEVDHLLQQDATGTLVMLELEAMGIERIRAEVGVQYVDHNLLQTDYRNADDHRFLQSAAARFGYWYSRPGNGISHVVHMERFGRPGKTMIGSDSHTCSAGAVGMLAIGSGGLDIASVATGKPYHLVMPRVMGVELKGSLPDWVSAKDVILEMLRRHDVKGGMGYIIEYFGEGLKGLSTWDRHVIANMGAELGATTTVFPSDEVTRQFLKQEEREDHWQEIKADPDAGYDRLEEIDLEKLVPLIATPSSPGNVVPVSEVAGRSISQVVVGSSANPGLRDFWIVSQIVQGKRVPAEVSLDINPSSRQKIEALGKSGAIADLIQAGGRFHQTGCMGCIGMGQAPSAGTISLRTMPRNFPGRSGTADDQVYLCSPETAAVSALQGVITDPLEYGKKSEYPQYKEPDRAPVNTWMLVEPSDRGGETELVKGPNIKSIPEFDKLEDTFKAPVILKMGDNVSTDEILKAGAEVLPLRSNIEAISRYCYQAIDSEYFKHTLNARDSFGGHLVVAGENYAQGSSREHAAMAPRFLGQKAVIAKSYARIGKQNLINYGIVPFLFADPADYEQLENRNILMLEELTGLIKNREEGKIFNDSLNRSFKVRLELTSYQRRVMLAGGLINYLGGGGE